MPLPLIRPGIVREELEHKNQRRKKVPPCKEKLFACRSSLGDDPTSCWGREEVEAGSRGERWFWKLRPTWSSPLLRCAAPRRDLRSLTAALRPSADVAALLRTRTPLGSSYWLWLLAPPSRPSAPFLACPCDSSLIPGPHHPPTVCRRQGPWGSAHGRERQQGGCLSPGGC